MNKSDTRKTYNNEPIRLQDNVIHFDGKLNPETNELKIYRLRGDIRLFDEAIQNFCIDNKIDKCIVK